MGTELFHLLIASHGRSFKQESDKFIQCHMNSVPVLSERTGSQGDWKLEEQTDKAFISLPRGGNERRNRPPENPAAFSDSPGGKTEEERTMPTSNSDSRVTNGHSPNLGCGGLQKKK